jgi:hypothetical protein
MLAVDSDSWYESSVGSRPQFLLPFLDTGPTQTCELGRYSLQDEMLNRRIQTRMLCADLVDFHWKDSGGRTRRGVANLEDISQSGACLQVDRQVPLGTDVHISYPTGELKGVVKYCVFRDIGYFVGVEFGPGVQWSQTRYRPQHLLDPRVLMMDSIPRISGAAAVLNPDVPAPADDATGGKVLGKEPQVTN